MIHLNEYVKDLNEVRLSDLKRPVSVPTKPTAGFFPRTNDSLRFIITELVKSRGPFADLNDIDTSAVTDMSRAFKDVPHFSGDISQWDVSNVKDMSRIFQYTHFNGDISGWDVSSVTNMMYAFDNSEFNGDISGWDVSHVMNMNNMFSHSEFDGDISRWDTGKVSGMSHMFDNSDFSGDISDWDVRNVIYMNSMFENATHFNCNLDRWKPLKLKNYPDIFRNCPLEKHPPKWYKV